MVSEALVMYEGEEIVLIHFFKQTLYIRLGMLRFGVTTPELAITCVKMVLIPFTGAALVDKP